MSENWRQRPEGGGYFALWLICTIGLYGGRRIARLFLAPITLYFFVRRGPERRASRAYLERMFAAPPTLGQRLRHFYYAAAVIMDRIFFLARGERGFDIQTRGTDLLDEKIARGTGLVLIGSHAGSFEALRAIASRIPDLPLRVVLDTQKTPAQTALFAQIAPDIAAHIIDASGDRASIVLALAETVAQGGIVAVLADRAREGEASLAVSFLGSPAPFPVGPWRLAAALKAPVVMGFSMYLGGNRYRLDFEPCDDCLVIPRGRREAALRSCIARYVERLEHHLCTAPYNWFNFYDFWDDAATVAAEPPADPAASDPGP